MRTKLFFRLLILLIPLHLSAQNEKCDFYSVGNDPELINGKLYTFFPEGTVKGNQFLENEEFSQGDLNIRGNIYKDQRLNYDIYNQQLLMKFQRPTGAESILVVSDAWLKGFEYLNKRFEFHKDTAQLPGIYQVIGDGSIRIFLHWEKRMLLRDVTGKAYYEFSSPSRKMYLENEEGITSFRNRRTFLKIIDPAIKGPMKKFLRSEKIKIRKADDEQLAALADYYETLVP